MRFAQIDNTPLRADNLSKTGAVYYLRWNDDMQNMYVQITDVVGGHGARNGTFSKNLYVLSDIREGSIHTGYDPADGSTKATSDNNMSGFLRAVRNDIIRRMNEQTDVEIKA